MAELGDILGRTKVPGFNLTDAACATRRTLMVISREAPSPAEDVISRRDAVTPWR